MMVQLDKDGAMKLNFPVIQVQLPTLHSGSDRDEPNQ